MTLVLYAAGVVVAAVFDILEEVPGVSRVPTAQGCCLVVVQVLVRRDGALVQVYLC